MAFLPFELVKVHHKHIWVNVWLSLISPYFLMFISEAFRNILNYLPILWNIHTISRIIDILFRCTFPHCPIPLVSNHPNGTLCFQISPSCNRRGEFVLNTRSCLELVPRANSRSRLYSLEKNNPSRSETCKYYARRWWPCENCWFRIGYSNSWGQSGQCTTTWGRRISSESLYSIFSQPFRESEWQLTWKPGFRNSSDCQRNAVWQPNSFPGIGSHIITLEYVTQILGNRTNWTKEKCWQYPWFTTNSEPDNHVLPQFSSCLISAWNRGRVRKGVR